jgi:hypothetical protein
MPDGERGEDIGGNQSDNPYSRGFGFVWQEREYWRHWQRVKRDTGRWPLWSLLFHVIGMLGFVTNVVLFFEARDSQNWSTSHSWVLGIGFLVLWLVFFGFGRAAIRSYEARLYTRTNVK